MFFVLLNTYKNIFNKKMSGLNQETILEKASVYPIKLLNLSRASKKVEKICLKLNFSNIYNICYMNSSIQCLFHLNDFVLYILKCEGIKRGQLTLATISLVKEMLNPKNVKNTLSVTHIKKAMGVLNELYKDNDQEDANVFISNYLNLLHEEIADKNKITKLFKEIDNEEERKIFEKFYNKVYVKKGSSFILDLFYGVLRTKRYCKCGIISKFYSPFNILELPISFSSKINNRETLNFNEILIDYISQKKILGAKCEKCKKQIYSKAEIYDLPKILIIYFGRSYDNYFIENDIDFPKEMDFNDFLSEDNNNDSDKCKYNLKNIIFYCKIGNKGHYYASCFNDNKWIYFDDHYIKNEDENYLYGIPIILFYEKDN